ncbi:SDR family NAD(P)-dependent oxidoreductase [Asticcacaulis sp. 201]|uniref:SDR family NAD(P)-dependent oxidoreductase n=1 Tax=Asticcacaulis sp. 201 TaxID=3028787 RepID=UPI0029163290|nr:SDR family oxidoreductase [Asticcacaulis sp. 201]MDV6330880.1 SDR family oxidoreductase [Asticcacaulis sp. 201]
MRFADKTAIVTGALGGIGLACARRLSAEGASLVLVDRVVEGAETLAEELRTLGAPKVVFTRCDVAAEDDVVAACKLAVEQTGRLDVVINVAGMMIYKSIADLTAAEWHELLGVNLVGAALFTREAFRLMSPGGAIVNISSIHAVQTSPLVAPYAAAKAALASLTRSSAIEGASLGIRANAILPGAIDTPMLWASPNLKSGAEVLEEGDVGYPHDIAHAAAFLASDEAAFITGASLNVDGGRLAKL